MFFAIKHGSFIAASILIGFDGKDQVALIFFHHKFGWWELFDIFGHTWSFGFLFLGLKWLDGLKFLDWFPICFGFSL